MRTDEINEQKSVCDVCLCQWLGGRRRVRGTGSINKYKWHKREKGYGEDVLNLAFFSFGDLHHLSGVSLSSWIRDHTS